jgi:hypothetical protein
MLHQIPNAFLIRALARRESPHCEGCGSRMFVPTRTGKCPYCYAGYPPRVVHRGDGEPAHLPFAPRLGERVVVDGWLSRLFSMALAWLSRRSRRGGASHPLALRNGEPGAHAHQTAG